ncbi:MAG: RNA polymerase sigma factor [Planctomycetota bacterium]|jgi:RNA polymerase sigma-70 factor (ECF subfamily)
MSKAEQSDAELVLNTLKGDKEAYGELVTRYQGQVYGLAHSIVDNWADAQDIAQETFIRAYSNLPQLRDPARFAAWLRRITFSVTMNWLKAFRPGLFEQFGSLEDINSLDLPDFTPGPPEIAERRELAETVLKAVAELPPKYRVPLTMFHLDGLSYQKVADFLDAPIGTIKYWIHRARQMLKPALSAYIAEEVNSMVQEVFNQHKLPPEFSRDVWNLCMDWLCLADESASLDSEKTKEQAERMALAAARDEDVATVNQWCQQAEPIPAWAFAIDKETPRYGFEICNHGWVDQLQRMVWMISHETALPSPAPGECGTIPACRYQWAALADDILSRWLASTSVSDEDAPLAQEIHALLGPVDNQKAGAVRLLRDTVRLAVKHRPRDFETAFDELKLDSDLAGEMRQPIKYLQFRCGYRWENIVLELCRAIGDRDYRSSRPLAWHVGKCNGQISFVYRDQPLRVPTTCGILVGIWAWLNQISPDTVASTYPTIAPLATHIRAELGQMTPVKRWLAGRLFVGIRIWLQEIDHGDIKQPRLAMEVYPTLADS